MTCLIYPAFNQKLGPLTIHSFALCSELNEKKTSSVNKAGGKVLRVMCHNFAAIKALWEVMQPGALSQTCGHEKINILLAESGIRRLNRNSQMSLIPAKSSYYLRRLGFNMVCALF